MRGARVKATRIDKAFLVSKWADVSSVEMGASKKYCAECRFMSKLEGWESEGRYCNLFGKKIRVSGATAIRLRDCIERERMGGN